MLKKYLLIISGIRSVCKILIDLLIKQLPVYYKNINKINLYKFYELLNGNYLELYKYKLTKRIPYFFEEVISDMMLDIPGRDNSIINKLADIAIMKALAARNNDKVMEFNAYSIENELNIKLNNMNKNILSLHQFIDYIEISFNCVGTIDPNKIKAARAFSLFVRAKEKNKKLQSVNSYQ